MTFSELINQLAREVVKTSLDDTVKSDIKACLNFGKRQVSDYALWSELIVPNNSLVLVPDYDTGTASIVEDSRIITISSGTVASNWKGRTINVKSVNYEIIDVDTTSNTVTTKVPVIDATESNLPYAIYKIWYRVPTDVRVVLPDNEHYDMPSPFDIQGYNDYESDYSTGLISVDKNSNVLTGDGTQSFLDNVYSGDMIKIQSYTYRVLRVSSNNEIIMTNKAISSYSGAYTITRDTPYKAKIDNRYNIYGSGSGTKKSLLNYRYIRYLYDMVNDNDTTELSTKFDRAILDFAKGEYGRNHPDQSKGWQLDTQLAIQRLKKLEEDKDLIYKSSAQFVPVIHRGMGRGRI